MPADLPPEQDPRAKLAWIILTIFLTVLLGGYMVVSQVRALVNAQVELPQQPDGDKPTPPATPVPPAGSPQPSKTPNNEQ
ncbi:hypothetical protein CFR73_01505 [Novacetimonas maltaceti]|uniref:Uncharacterized protein n=1 Tax=Novacetimonas maltaceti TaxID=1203393 RepID=A0A2S3W0Z6_9PROT|nr:hypothetical protein [Novacetimonas maltaceti]POF62532.1 hypothetical protein KMAL_18260 [Novacetimonas maltaceti]PYD61744.1 hypothetical protein CFR73_01505 [Novacetimonas maltaceti]